MRFIARMRAKLGGYYWLPCPVCGRMFGGHESGRGPHSTLWDSPNGGRAVCRQCEGSAEVLASEPYVEPDAIRAARIALAIEGERMMLDRLSHESDDLQAKNRKRNA